MQLFKEIKIAKSTAPDIQIPSDATNSCAFLSVLITDLFVGNHAKVPVLNNVLAK